MCGFNHSILCHKKDIKSRFVREVVTNDSCLRPSPACSHHTDSVLYDYKVKVDISRSLGVTYKPLGSSVVSGCVTLRVETPLVR